jgi:hypothetical protein
MNIFVLSAHACYDMKGKALLLVVALTAIGMTLAQVVVAEERVNVKGVYYDMDRTARQAKVAGMANKEGDIDTSLQVPVQFVFDGEVYTVTEIADRAFDVSKSDRKIRIRHFSTEGKLLRIGKKAFSGVELDTFYTADGCGPMKVDSGAFSSLAGTAKSITFGKGTQIIGKDALSKSSIEALSIPVGLSHLHIDAMRGDGIDYVKHLYLNWRTPRDIPEGLIDATGSSLAGQTMNSDELLRTFILSVCGFGKDERHWVSKIHVPKIVESETTYRASLFWKEIFAKGDVLYNNLYNVTVKSDPEFAAPQVVPAGTNGYPYGSDIKIEAKKPNGYYLLNWVSGSEVISNASAFSFPVTGDAVVVAHFVSDTIIKDGIEYVPVQGTSAIVVGRNAGYKGKPALKISSTVTDAYSLKDYTVQEISESAFLNNGIIDSVYISNGVKTIKANAFNGCRNLHAIVLPVTLETILPTAFLNVSAELLDIYVGWEDVAHAKNVIEQWLNSLSAARVRLHVPKGSYKGYSAVFGSGVVLENSCIWASPNVAGYGKVEIKGMEGKVTPFPYIVSPAGDSITLKAVPAGGYVFRHWTTRKGDILSGKSEYTISVDSDKDIVAVFAPEVGVVYVSVGGTGGGYISSGQSGIYQYGDVLSLEAAPNKGYTFDHWLVLEHSLDTVPRKITTAKLEQTVRTDTIDIIAVFTSSLRLSVTSLSSGKGTLSVTSPQYGKMEGTTSIDASLAYGVPVTLNVENLAKGYRVAWVTSTGIVLSTDNPYTFTLTNNSEILVRFNDLCAVTLGEGTGGSITVRGLTNGYCSYGTVITVEVKGEAGYQLGSLNITDSKGDVEKKSGASPYKITVIDDIRISADFFPERYTVTCAYDVKGGQISGLLEERYSYGELVHLTAIPESGYRFTGWKDKNNILLSSQSAYDIFVIGDVSLRADFVHMSLSFEDPLSSFVSSQVYYTSGVLHFVHFEGAVVEVVSLAGRLVGRFYVGSDQEGKVIALPAGVYAARVTKDKEGFITKFVVKTE